MWPEPQLVGNLINSALSVEADSHYTQVHSTYQISKEFLDLLQKDLAQREIVQQKTREFLVR
ncbi:hypothetical protein EON65_27375 [archaeon]|nr:MAG: hypothetical protein EON65_27375 [archaeon]